MRAALLRAPQQLPRREEVSRRMPSSENEDRRSSSFPRRRRPHSPLVAGLGRSEAWLGLLEQSLHAIVGQLAKRLLARSGSLRRIASYPRFLLSIHDAREHETEFVLVVR